VSPVFKIIQNFKIFLLKNLPGASEDKDKLLKLEHKVPGKLAPIPLSIFPLPQLLPDHIKFLFVPYTQYKLLDQLPLQDFFICLE
jgi:hypothetical protein